MHAHALTTVANTAWRGPALDIWTKLGPNRPRLDQQWPSRLPEQPYDNNWETAQRLLHNFGACRRRRGYPFGKRGQTLVSNCWASVLLVCYHRPLPKPPPSQLWPTGVSFWPMRLSNRRWRGSSREGVVKRGVFAVNPLLRTRLTTPSILEAVESIFQRNVRKHEQHQHCFGGPSMATGTWVSRLVPTSVLGCAITKPSTPNPKP